MSAQTLPYALVGAGPMGLAAARNLGRFGVPFEGFELHHDVGGLWDIDNPRSTVYHSAHLISSKRMTEFTEFPMRDEAADYPDHREVLRYFHDYADHFDLRRHFRFGARVVRAERLDEAADGPWRVTWETRDDDGETSRQSDLYRGLLLAVGTFAHPKLPELPGTFDGEVYHSSEYKDPEIFAGRRVLVIGAGNSGCDIAVDAVHRAASVSMSLRRGYHFVPKYLFGKPADAIGGKLKLPRWLKQRIDKFLLRLFTGDPTRFGFPEPDHALYECHPIVNSLVLYHAGHGDVEVRPDVERLDGETVHFADGTASEYDLLLYATGYHLRFPFVDSEELNWRGAAPHLYLNCFHPARDDVCVLGMVEAAGLGWQGRWELAELAAGYLAGRDAGAPEADSFRRAKMEPFDDMRGGWDYLPLDRMAFYVHKDTYRDAVRDHARAFRHLARD